MLNIGSEFRDLLKAGDRRYIEQAVITAKNANNQSVTLTLRENAIWSNGFGIEGAVSSDNNFDLGGAIIGKGTLVIDNINDAYTDYIFEGATVVLSIGHVAVTNSFVQKGVYTVDEATYTGELITLSCLDNMHKFDKPYSEVPTIYSSNLQGIVADICTICGVTFSNDTQEFPHYDYEVVTRPDDDKLTCRQMISYVAQMVGCYAICDSRGELRIQPFNFTALETASDSESTPHLVGATGFNPDNYDSWDQKCHLILSTYSSSIGIDDVVITGVRVTGTFNDQEVSELDGDEGYVIEIRDNPLIAEGDLDDVAHWIGSTNINKIIGRHFRVASLTHLSDPSIEPGDVAYVKTRKGVYHPILISSTKFTANNSQTTRSSAASPARNSATRFSALAQTYLALQERIEQEKTEREQAIANLNGFLVDMPEGAWTTLVGLGDPQGSEGYVYYIHDRENLEDSTDVQKITAEGWGAATGENVDITKVNGVYVDNSHYGSGIDTHGNAIMSMIYAVGIIADYIHLYGDMNVYQTRGADTLGGKLGFGLGQSGWGSTTRGIHMLSLNSKAEVIATTDGARLSYFDDNDKPSNAVVALPESAQLHTNGTIGLLTYDAYVMTYRDASGSPTEMGASLSCVQVGNFERSEVVCNDTEVFMRKQYPSSNNTMIVGANATSVYSSYIEGSSENKITINKSGISIDTNVWQGTDPDKVGDITIGSGNDVGIVGVNSVALNSNSVAIGYRDPGTGYKYARFSANDSQSKMQYNSNCNITCSSTGISADSNSAVTISGSSLSTTSTGSTVMELGQSGVFQVNIGGARRFTAGNSGNSVGAWMQYSNKRFVSTTSSGSALHYDEYIYCVAESNECRIQTSSTRYVACNSSGYGAVRMQYNSDTYVTAYYDTSGGNTVTLHAGGVSAYLNSGGWHDSSDRKLKHDITYDVDGDIVEELKPARFKFNGSDKESFGFIAQDVQEILPDLVSEDSEGYLGLKYNDFIPILTAKVQKQQKVIDEQQKTIDIQQKQIESLEARLSKLESLLNTEK